MTTRKNKIEFEDWYIHKSSGYNEHNINVLEFYQLPFEMQIGVLLAYYDSLGIDIDMDSWEDGFSIMIFIKNTDLDGIQVGEIFESRPQAFEEAFKKADEIRNNQLNK